MLGKARFGMMLAAFALFAAPQAGAQTPQQIVERLSEAGAADPEVAALLNQLQRQIDRSGRGEVAGQAIAQLFQLAPDGALTEAIVAQHARAQLANRRARLLMQYLSHDFDGDGSLTPDERAAVGPAHRADVEVLFLQADTDGDAILTFAELSAEAQRLVGESRGRRSLFERILMLMDADRNGTVTVDDVVTTLDALAGAEAGQTPQEAAPLTREQILNSPFGQSVAGVRPTCSAPNPPDDAQFIVLSAYEGSALSTVSVAGMDEETQVARLVIEAGDAPVFVFVTAHEPVIWDVSGAVDRLAGMVVQGRGGEDGPWAGVIGVDAERVHFVAGETCVARVSDMDDGEALLAYRQAEQSFGRAPDVMLAHYTVRQIALPSGGGLAEGGEGTDIVIYDGRRYELGPNGPRALDETDGQFPDGYPLGATETFRSLMRFHPDGVHTIDAARVVSPGPVAEYDVMPQQAGLLQLVLEGRLRYSRDRFYQIVAPIERFPAGLNGAHSVRFILGEGIPMPAGSPGHSSVYSAETGECLTRSCR
jgi:hypothetical protein